MSLPESRIAIVGIACQMPAPAGSETHLNKEQFWQHLKEGGGCLLRLRAFNQHC